MLVSLRNLFPFIFCAVMIVSCGKELADNNATTPSTNVPQNENDRGDDTNRTIRYSSIVLEENCGFWTDCDFTIRADFNRRPVILKANFIDNGFPDEDSIDEGNCNFQVNRLSSLP